MNLIRSGRNWFGARLSALGANTATWNIPLNHAVLGTPATVRFGAAMRSVGTGSASQLNYEFEGQSVTLTDNLLSPSSLLYARYVGGELIAPLTIEGIQVLATFTPGTDDSNAWIDFLTYQASQNLIYTSGQMHINGLPIDAEGNPVAGAEYVLGGNAPDEVWDVTDPLEVKRVATTNANGSTVWQDVVGDAPKRYAAFRWSSVLRPEALGAVGNSNVHGLGEVDNVIVTVPGLLEAADSLASLHAARGLRVAVVPQQDVFDAFSSGVADPTAVKMLMMMLTDRAAQSDGAIQPPRYLTLMGDASYENRNVQGNGTTIVGHYSSESLQTTTSYISDDYFALVAEGQSEKPEELLQLGVGRIPASDLASAMAVVGKVATYSGVDEGAIDAASCLDPNGTST
ncbi:MAG: C25 family cysteine peptidase, partial [Bacteroidota bacterium]|nr:C25 family cysteine peptidase [Bacteroidota bacterium]